MYDLLQHRSYMVRLLAAWLIGVGLLAIAWYISYLWLPEGLISQWAGFVSSGVPDASGISVVALAVSIALRNLLRGIGITAIASLFSVGRFPLGYLVPWVSLTLYGVLLGTNSFGLPNSAGPVAPAISVAWTRSGLRELTAYILVAAALAKAHLWRQRSWLDMRTQRVRSWAEIRLAWPEVLGLIAALALIGWSAYTEAWQIVGRP